MSRIMLSVAIVFCHIAGTFAASPPLRPGDKAPEILLSSPTGKSVPLSSLKGKIVLIDFWATWCAPCVQEQPELAKLYTKFKHARFSNAIGFEIYGVSLDAKLSNWEKAIKNMQLNWVQVSDLKFWKSPVAKDYNIQELPFNLLIDAKGVILAINLHGVELEKKLASLQ